MTPSSGDVVGVRALIKSVYGKLCGQPRATTEAAQVAYIAARVAVPGNVYFVETGWGRRRDEGKHSTFDFVFAEMFTPNLYQLKYRFYKIPTQNSQHSYQIDLDVPSAIWTYNYDNLTPIKLHDAYWTTELPQYLEWAGEIYNFKDDMPGKVSDPCEFTSCQFRQLGGIYVDAGFGPFSIFSPDTNQWNFQLISGKAFNIWDVHPLS